LWLYLKFLRFIREREGRSEKIEHGDFKKNPKAIQKLKMGGNNKSSSLKKEK
jgi:hypothetical protein